MFSESPAEVVKEELPRMRGVAKLFRTTFVAFGVAAGVGLALLYLVGAPWARGLGSALILIGGIGLLVDGFAERRTEPYIDALEQLAEPTV